MKEELKQFNINLDDITFNNNFFDNLNEATQKMKLETLKDRFEVVLNNNLIESKEKLTNYRTIMGCRISYEDLDRNISFIVREDMKPTYEELEKENGKLKEVQKKTIDYFNGVCTECYLDEDYNIDLGLVEYGINMLKGENDETI